MKTQTQPEALQLCWPNGIVTYYEYRQSVQLLGCLSNTNPRAEAIACALVSCRYLLLDGRSNTDLRGIKGLLQLTGLKTLVMPLLHLHHTNNTLLGTMQAALPATHIVNVSGTFGRHHGCQWFRVFSADDREWWLTPAQPWKWYPTLDIQP